MEVLELGHNQAMRKQMMKKRCFDEAFENCGGGTAGRKSPALVQWSRQPSDDEDDQKNEAVDQGNVEEKGIIVGWPPICSWRKRHLHDHQGVVNFY